VELRRHYACKSGFYNGFVIYLRNLGVVKIPITSDNSPTLAGSEVVKQSTFHCGNSPFQTF
jgi:hypothetical protein